MPEQPSDETIPTGHPHVVAERYEILRRIGEGAVFVVFRARDRKTGNAVALKCLQPALAADERLSEILISESRALRALRHPNVVSILDAGRDGATVYVVAELVEGTSLAERIRQAAPLPVAVCVDIALEISQALAQAHQQGFIHGDLRPSNVFLAPDGRARVAGFGLARALSASSDVRMNSVLRWVQCMAPEVTEGAPARAESDIYSLGCVLYEMLTASPLFTADNAIVLALKHAREAPRPVRQVNPSIPPALSDVVMRSLEKDPARRISSTDEMRTLLRMAQDALRYNKPLDYTPAHLLTPATQPAADEADLGDDASVPRYLVILRNIVLTLVGAGFVFSVYFLYTLLQPQKDVPVPEVVGMPMEQAQRLLSSRDLQSNVVERESTRPAGTVLNQEPDANKSVKPGRMVTLFVSRGPKMVEVPAITEMSLERADQIAQSAGLRVRKNGEVFSDTVQKGYVIDQTPNAGERVKPGQTVKVTVSKGPEPIPEPEPPPAPEYPIAPAPYYQPTVPGQGAAPPVRPTGRLRTFKISFQVPASGYESPVNVRIVVLDERGEFTVVDEQRALGDTVQKTIEGVGERVIIRVFLNGVFYSEEVK